MNRAGRRRLAKPQNKPKSSEELEKQQAEKELLEGIEDEEVNPRDEFLTRLAIWLQYDGQRFSAREWYQLLTELKGSTQDKDRWVQNYQAAKKGQQVLEPRMADSLSNMDKDDVELVLTKTFAISSGGAISCPESLAKKLREMLNHNEQADS